MEIEREKLFKRIQNDLIGPTHEDEILEERPIDRYITGILYPLNTLIEQDEDDEINLPTGDEESSNGDTASETVILSNVIKPSCIGLSFRVLGKPNPCLNFEISFGSYKAIEPENDGEKRKWKRTPKKITLNDVRVDFSEKGKEIFLIDSDPDAEGLKLFIKSWGKREERNITVALINEREKGSNSVEGAERAIYQVKMVVSPSNDTNIIPRLVETYSHDDEDESLALLYSKIKEYAVGHTCSAEWKEGTTGNAGKIYTSWFPKSEVAKVSPDGCEELKAIGDDTNIYSAKFLGEGERPQVLKLLSLFADAYLSWIEGQKKMASSLSKIQYAQAEKHVEKCLQIYSRIKSSIYFMETNEGENAFDAFQAANRAINLQSSWAQRGELVWRPFQLGFQLLVLESLARGQHQDRTTLDLLWFPTGGGKTEAYLGLVAFTLFYSRLSNKDNPDKGSGVNVIMRYTLRLLTTQQFQRAARLITACEYIRLTDVNLKPNLGTRTFSLGLWVGRAATPNEVSKAYNEANEREKAKQLVKCPHCNCEELSWGNDPKKKKFTVICRNNQDCFFGKNSIELPVYTIDEDIYRELPSFIIGTIDKFAQIAREERTRKIFGIDTSFDNPSLIIQDELHLISGPLGTMTGLYEIAIDLLCTSKGVPPKIIASTATIRNASEQVKALFNRTTSQFPPHGIYEDDSGFALKQTNVPGRLYVGTTTAGRSAKYVLQALCASILQYSNSNEVKQNQSEDEYWTLVTYFNSLRELGGAGVMMTDDVPSSIKTFANRYNESPRLIPEVTELTGSRKQEEITRALNDLDLKSGNLGAVDVVLASSMISVGVDVDRLSVMVVNGQPKTVSEYIQATSRVGRSSVPGIVFTIYNHNKSRDKSRFETFCTWHKALYRDVEGTSVTPFASRARDKAIHAPLIVLARYLIDGILNTPRIDDSVYEKCLVFLEAIYERAVSVDPDEADDVREELKEFLLRWKRKEDLEKYWADTPNKHPLMISAEMAASLIQTGKSLGGAIPTPNSMREVEPGVTFKFLNGIPKER